MDTKIQIAALAGVIIYIIYNSGDESNTVKEIVGENNTVKKVSKEQLEKIIEEKKDSITKLILNKAGNVIGIVLTYGTVILAYSGFIVFNELAEHLNKTNFN